MYAIRVTEAKAATSLVFMEAHRAGTEFPIPVLSVNLILLRFRRDVMPMNLVGDAAVDRAACSNYPA
jgi:hypothetical protein